jgi:hypothetical protein
VIVQDIQGQLVYLKSSGTKEPFDTVAFKILSFSSCTRVPVFIQLLETLVGFIMNGLLQESLWNQMNILCVVEMTTLHLFIYQ